MLVDEHPARVTASTTAASRGANALLFTFSAPRRGAPTQAAGIATSSDDRAAPAIRIDVREPTYAGTPTTGSPTWAAVRPTRRCPSGRSSRAAVGSRRV